MRLEKDFKEFIALLNEYEVRYLIIGGYAFSYYAEPRFTKDIDFLIEPATENIDRLLMALDQFGFGSLGLNKEDFLDPDQVIQLGLAPVRIDLLTSIEGVEFATAWERKTIGSYGDVQALYISKTDLLISKEKTGRLQDKADAEKLKRIQG